MAASDPTYRGNPGGTQSVAAPAAPAALATVDNLDDMMDLLAAYFLRRYGRRLQFADFHLDGLTQPIHYLAPSQSNVETLRDEESGVRPLCPSERAVLELIEQTGERMLGDQIRNELCTPKGIYGESTINRDLASLVKRGRIDNPRKGGGYGLVGWE